MGTIDYDAGLVRQRWFDRNYKELLKLKDGSEVVVRPIRPDDGTLLLAGLRGMSKEARYRRFFTPKKTLSEPEIAYLTNLDLENHFAVGAGGRGPDGDVEDPYGVGRFVRERDDPHCAEVSIAIVDSMQGKGLGTRLLERLVLAAHERGIHTFRMMILATNRPMIKLLRSIFPNAKTCLEDGLICASCPLADARLKDDVVGSLASAIFNTAKLTPADGWKNPATPGSIVADGQQEFINWGKQTWGIVAAAVTLSFYTIKSVH